MLSLALSNMSTVVHSFWKQDFCVFKLLNKVSIFFLIKNVINNAQIGLNLSNKIKLITSYLTSLKLYFVLKKRLIITKCNLHNTKKKPKTYNNINLKTMKKARIEKNYQLKCCYHGNSLDTKSLISKHCQINFQKSLKIWWCFIKVCKS